MRVLGERAGCPHVASAKLVRCVYCPQRVRRLIASDPMVLLGVIIFAGLVLRVVDAGTRINEDEGYSWLVATAPSAGAFLSRLARFENTPPLFYVLLVPLPLDSEVWLRLPSILAGVASIPVLYAIVRPLLGVRAALLAALGLAVAPFAVSYSDFSRGFMVAGLGVLVALLSAQRLAGGGLIVGGGVTGSAGRGRCTPSTTPAST